MKENEESLQETHDKFMYRRRLAFISLIANVVIILGSFILTMNGIDLSNIVGLLITAIGAFTTIICAYLGVATVYDVSPNTPRTRSYRADDSGSTRTW